MKKKKRKTSVYALIQVDFFPNALIKYQEGKKVFMTYMVEEIDVLTRYLLALQFNVWLSTMYNRLIRHSNIFCVFIHFFLLDTFIPSDS